MLLEKLQMRYLNDSFFPLYYYVIYINMFDVFVNLFYFLCWLLEVVFGGEILWTQFRLRVND